MATQILAIDSATEVCSVALWRDKKIFTQKTTSPREHAKKILPMIEQCLIDADLDLEDVDVLAFSRGPGSFTGIRIATGVAQGLAFGANLPMVGVSSLLAIAQGAYRQLGTKKVLVAMDAKMGEIYSACYELKSNGYWQGEETEATLKPEQFLAKINDLTGEWTAVGTGWLTYPILRMTNLDLFKSNIYLSDAEDIMLLALGAWKRGKILKIEEAQPVYLRNKINWKRLPGR